LNKDHQNPKFLLGYVNTNRLSKLMVSLQCENLQHVTEDSQISHYKNDRSLTNQ